MKFLRQANSINFETFSQKRKNMSGQILTKIQNNNYLSNSTQGKNFPMDLPHNGSALSDNLYTVAKGYNSFNEAVDFNRDF